MFLCRIKILLGHPILAMLLHIYGIERDQFHHYFKILRDHRVFLKMWDLTSALRMISEGPDSSAAVDHAMLSEIVKYVLKLGFAYDLVRRIVEKKLKEGLSIEALIDDFLEAEN